MQRTRFAFGSFFVALLLAVPAWTVAQDSSADAILNRVAAYLDKSTIFVGHFDLKKVDPEKSVATLREIVDGAVKKSEMLQPMKPMIAQGFDALASGVKENEGIQTLQLFQKSGCEMYVIVNSMTMTQSPARILYAFDTSASTSNIDAIQKELETQSPPGALRIQRKDSLIVVDAFQPGVESGNAEKLIDGFDKSRRPLVRPELLAAMERAKSAPFKLAFAMDDGLKGMFQMFYSMTPPEIQQMLPAKTLLDGAEWISLGVDVNRWIIDLNIKGKNPAASKALYDAIIKLKNDALTQAMADFPGQEKAMNSQIMPFIPKVQEDRLRLTINQKFLDDNLPNILQYALPAVIAAQRGGIQLPFE